MSTVNGVIIDLPASLGIAGLSALKAEIDPLLQTGSPMLLDFSAVQRIDTAGLQCLLALVRAAGERISASGPCPALQSLVELYNLDGALAPLLTFRECADA